MSNSVNIKDISDQMLKELWLSEQIPYEQYMAEIKRRAEEKKSND